MIDEFPDAAGYLNTASLGLPALGALDDIRTHLDDWQLGRADPPAFDALVDRARHAYASIVGTTAAHVGIAAQVSTLTGLVASCLPDGAHVLCAEEDFTSVLFPFLADDRLRVRLVPLDELLDHVRAGVDLVAVSAVQSADGRMIDLDALADAARSAGARTFVDTTQAAGWLPVRAEDFDVTACGAYKWLSCPRGTAFLTVADAGADWLVPRHANWYAGADIWSSIYGPPLRLADDARRFDASPAWIAWVGSVAPLEALATRGPSDVGRHDVALADALRAELDLPPAGSAIVSLDLDDAAVDALRRADVRMAGRAGRIRLSFHHYNTTDDVSLVTRALRGQSG